MTKKPATPRKKKAVKAEKLDTFTDDEEDLKVTPRAIKKEAKREEDHSDMFPDLLADAQLQAEMKQPF